MVSSVMRGRSLPRGLFPQAASWLPSMRVMGMGAMGEPRQQDVEDLGSATDAGVKEVACDHEAGGFGVGDELVDACEVGVGVAFGDGETAGAEGGGFAEVGVGEDEGA